MKLSFLFRNETPGALRYQEVDKDGNVLKSDADRATIGTLYIRKKALQGKVPQELLVQISTGPPEEGN